MQKNPENKNQNKLKNNKTKKLKGTAVLHKITPQNLVCAGDLLLSIGPALELIYTGTFLRKTDFPFASSYQIQIVSW